MEKQQFFYEAFVRSIYDGDTIRVDIDLGFNIWSMNSPVRLAGLDAPEVRGDERVEGLKSRDWLALQIPVGTRIFIQTTKDSREKYGRYLATIYMADGTNLNEKMLAEGLAVVY